MNNTMGATNGAGTANLPKHMSSSPVLVGFGLLNLKFCVVCIVIKLVKGE